MILFRVKTSSIQAATREFVKRAKRAGPAMALEMKEVIIDNSNHLRGIDGKKNKKLTPAYEAFKRRMGLYPQPDFRGLTNSFLDNAVVKGNTLTPHPSDAKKAEGLMNKRKPWPREEADVSKAGMKRLINAGERAISD